jgi:hypothetical protein
MATPPPRPSALWFLHRQTADPNVVDQLEIDCPGAPHALAVFSTPRAARRYRAQRLGPEWELFSLEREHVLAWLADMAGAGAAHVVLDPAPQGGGKVLTVFQAMVEWP